MSSSFRMHCAPEWRTRRTHIQINALFAKLMKKELTSCLVAGQLYPSCGFSPADCWCFQVSKPCREIDVTAFVHHTALKIEIFAARCLHQARPLPSCAVCVCVCLSVCLSDTFVHSVKTGKHIVRLFSPSNRPIILVFPNQTGVEFYLYSTVSTALIHSVKPGLIRWD